MTNQWMFTSGWRMPWTHSPRALLERPPRVEIELIKIVFTYEEASLAGQLTRTPETAAEIAQAGWPR